MEPTRLRPGHGGPAEVPIWRGEDGRDAVVRACSYASVVGTDTARSAALAGSNARNSAPLASEPRSAVRGHPAR